MSRLSSFRLGVLSGLVGLAIGLTCSFVWASFIQYPGEDCSGVWVWQPPNVYIVDAVYLVLGQLGHVLVALALVQVGVSITAALRQR